MERQEILYWLRCTDPRSLEELWQRADRVRQEHVGAAVHLRGLVEISNHCFRACHYCGLRAANHHLDRYRMSEAEIVDAARTAVELGYGTLVLQSGEDDGLDAAALAALLQQIKSETALALTLSLGERSDADLALWREAGADRYLLRFETSDQALYRAIHPDRPGRTSDRIAILRRLRALGYEIGSGVMVGIPGQTHATLAADLQLFQELNLDMIGIGPFIAHPQTPLGMVPAAAPHNQVVPDITMTCKMVALSRILCPEANIPATTAVAVMDAAQGRALALRAGANVIMPNLTPARYRELYSIYPGKADRIEVAAESDRQIRQQIAGLGREVGQGAGGRKGHGLDSEAAVRPRLRLAICMGSSCFSRGNNGQALDALRHCVEGAGFVPEISGHLCENQCTEGPHITIEGTLYSHVQASCFPELLRHHLASGREKTDG